MLKHGVRITINCCEKSAINQIQKEEINSFESLDITNCPLAIHLEVLACMINDKNNMIHILIICRNLDGFDSNLTRNRMAT